MVRRVFGLNYGTDITRVVSQIESTASQDARVALDVEISIDLGATTGSAEYLYLKNNRALVLSRARAVLDEMESGRQPWPPILT